MRWVRSHPSAAASRDWAASCGSEIPISRSRAVARRSVSEMVEVSSIPAIFGSDFDAADLSGGLFLQFFGLVVRDEGFDHFIEGAFHDLVELVDSKADPVIGDAVLLEIVCSDLLRAVAASDHRAALG